MISKFQKFEIVEIDRSEIKNAEYNPRVISQKAKNKLRKSLKKFGLVEPLIWNKQTGNLVSGHQRLQIIDDIEGNNEYKITVSACELTIEKEMQQNVFLNNTSAQGEYVLEKLEDIEAKFPNISWADAGFEIPQEEVSEPYVIPKTNIPERSDNVVEPSTESQVKFHAAEELYDKRPTESLYVTLSFTSIDVQNALLIKLGLDENIRYIKGEMLIQYLNEHFKQ